MATKTLTITEEAYEALRAQKFGDESFSKVVMRITKKKGIPEKYFGMWSNDEGLRTRIAEARRKTDRDMEARRKRFTRDLA